MAGTAKLAPLSNREDYIESFQAIDSETGDAIDLTGATVVYSIRDKDSSSEVMSASTSNGRVTISTTTMIVNIPVATVRTVSCPKDYHVGCTILINGVTLQFFVGTISIYDGIVP